MFGLIYTVALIDRSNISVARLSGLDEDLGLDVGNRVSIARGNTYSAARKERRGVLEADT